jgi:hypothetical protein
VLAEKFNCTPTNISKILNGHRWQKKPDWLQGDLTMEDVAAIQSVRGTRTRRELSEAYGVSPSKIYRIQRGEGYGHLETHWTKPRR